MNKLAQRPRRVLPTRRILLCVKSGLVLLVVGGVASAGLAAASTPSAPVTLPHTPATKAAPARPATVKAVAVPVNNSAVTYDTFGVRVDAHDGQIVKDPASGLFYLFGTSYGCGFTLSAPATPWCGVRVYRSADLQTWTPAGAVGGMYAFDPFTDEFQGECDSAHFGCFRPHVARRPDGTWVMWVNAIRDPAGYIVLTATAPGGPYTRTDVPPVLALGPTMDGVGYGDESITVDPADPTSAWLTYTALGTAHNHQIAVEQLDPTWTTGTGAVAFLPELHVEAPSMFKRGALWYMMYSDPACPYCSNAGSSYDTASSPFGPWTKRGTPWPSSCVGQPAAVNALNSQFIYQSDRWAQKPAGGYQPNQYQANNYLAPVTFNTDGTIPAQHCIASWTL